MAVEMQDVFCLHTLCPLKREILSGEHVFCILQILDDRGALDVYLNHNSLSLNHPSKCKMFSTS